MVSLYNLKSAIFDLHIIALIAVVTLLIITDTDLRAMC